jgi:hypothetical protein
MVRVRVGVRVRLKGRVGVQVRVQAIGGVGVRVWLPNASPLSEDGVDLQAHYDLHVVGQRTGVIEKSTGYRLALAKGLATYPTTKSKPMKESCLVMIKTRCKCKTYEIKAE